VRFECPALGKKILYCICSPAELDEKSHMGFIDIMVVCEF
jgi:hypothetical protein